MQFWWYYTIGNCLLAANWRYYAYSSIYAVVINVIIVIVKEIVGPSHCHYCYNIIIRSDKCIAGRMLTVVYLSTKIIKFIFIN